MQSLALQRVRKLLDGRGALIARFLGVVQALLLLALVAWSGLLLELALSRGVTRVEPGSVSRTAPHAWIARRLPAGITPEADVVLTNTGLYPMVARNLESRNPAHRLAARGVFRALRAFPALRHDRGALIGLLGLGLALVVAQGLVDRWRLASLSAAAGQVAEGLRRQVHRQLYRLGQSVLPSEGIGPVVNLFTREVNDVRDGIAAELDQIPRTPVLAVGLLGLALLVASIPALFLGSLGLLLWMAHRALDRRSRLAGDLAGRNAALQLLLLHEDLNLLRTVRVYGMEAWDNRRFDEHLAAYGEADTRQLRAGWCPSPASATLAGLAAVVGGAVLGYSSLVGRVAPASLWVLLASFALLWRRPLTDWLALGRTVRQANRSAAGVFEFLDRRPDVLQAGGARFLPPLRERIQFENVTLRSPSGRVLLDGVSAEIPSRTRTAIMGPDEDAKHALVCLIPRLITPQGGRVRIDGVDLGEVTLESVRAQVAIVLQADLVFSDSVVANIGLGDPGFGLPRIIEAAKMAHAHHFIQDLPNGYDTIIGPLGHHLRPDEQFRIGLARAFLHDPTIVIVEEPNTTLDEATRHLLDDSLTRLGTGRTMLFLPQRLSTLRSCDQVIVLQEGRIESMGPPRELQGASKLFRHLQYVQFNQFATGEIEAGQMNG